MAGSTEGDDAGSAFRKLSQRYIEMLKYLFVFYLPVYVFIYIYIYILLHTY